MGSFRTLRLRVAIIVTLLVCAGCASGGGGGGVTVPVSPPVSPPASPPASPPGQTSLNPPLVIPPAPTGYSASEYAANYGVGATGAAAAWSRGYTGAGIKIGVIDDGLEDASQMSAQAYQEIVGRVDPASRDIVVVNGVARNQLSSSLSHGTELTSIIAGNKNGGLTVGVAHDATILAIRADNGSGNFGYHDLALALNYAVSQGVKIVNFSLGASTPATNEFRQALSAATAAGVIIVNSAGNEGTTDTEVNYPGFYSTDPSVSRGLIISAGGVNPDGTFNTRSNPAGQAANFYLTAPGWEIRVPDYGPAGPVFIDGNRYQYCGPELGLPNGICQIQGTSYAAPHISGAIALLLQAYPGLTPQQIVQLALISTEDQAAPGVDAVTGHGRFNMVKAFQPVGTVAAPVSGSGGEILAGTPIGVVGAAFGDALVDPARWASVGFDDFGRTFAFNLGASWLRTNRPSLAGNGQPLLWRTAQGQGISTSFALADAAPPEAARMIGEAPKASFRSTIAVAPGRQLSFASGVPAIDDNPGVPAQGLSAFAGYDQSVALSQTLSNGMQLSFLSQGGEDALGPRLGFSSKQLNALRLNLGGTFGGVATLGAITEKGSVLGSSWEQRFGAPPEAATRFIALGGGRQLAPDWDVALQGEVGATRISNSGWLNIPGDIVTTSGSASLRWRALPLQLAQEHPDLSGALTFAISQPLRVERGYISARLPTANDYGRQSLTFVERRISALPTGRELDASVDYSVWTQNNFSGRLSAMYRHQPGHEAAAPGEAMVSVAMRYGF